MTTTDYTGRQLDLELLQSVTTPTALQRVHLTSVGNEPKIVSGIEKAVQRYTVLLLTTVGDIRFDPGVGGVLVSKLAGGQIQNLGYLYHVFALANSSALKALAHDDGSEVFGSIPDDERITHAVLENAAMDYATGTASLTVVITTAAGSAFTYVVPVNTLR